MHNNAMQTLTTPRSGLGWVWLACASALCVGVAATSTAESPPHSAAGPELRIAVRDHENCSACHEMDSTFSHPVNITPSMHVPSGLPLFAGRVTCETCHDGASAKGHATTGAKGRTFLRTPEELGSLCSSCHSPGTGRSASHAGGHLRAHLAATDLRRGRAGVDEESLSCMGCHDGATASDASAHKSLGGQEELADDHPIGVAIDGPRANGDACDVRPANAIDRRVRLFNRAVGCGSCHSVYAARKDLLVMSNARSTLCLTCHVQ